MTDLAVQVRLTADGSGLVGQLNAAEAQAKGFGDAARKAGTDAKTASTGTADLAGSTAKVGEAARGATAGLERNTRAVASNAVSVGAQRAGYQQLGAQVQDSFVQFNAGTNVLQILSQQGPQVASALSLAGTAADGSGSKVARLATFFAGPWGAAVFGAATVAGFFIQNLIKSGDESDKAGGKALSFTEALSKEKRGTDEATNALKAFNKEKEEGRRQDSLSTQESLRLGRARLQEAINTRIALQAIIDKAAAEVANGPTGPGGQGQIGAAFVLRGLGGIKEQNEKFIKELRKSLVNLTIEDAGAAATASVDPIARLNREFDNQRDRATRAAGALDKLTAAQERQLRSNLAGIESRRKAALDAERERQAADRRTGSGIKGELAGFDRPVSGGSITGQFAERRPGHNHGGLDYAVPVGTPIRAPQAGTVDFAGTAGDYGNLLRLAHGAGTQTRYGHLSRFAVEQGQQVEKGDVIGYTGGARGAPGAGNSRGAHLHYEVRVNGKPVDPSKGQFPIDPVDVAAAGEKAREVAERKAEALAQFGDKARESITRALAGFDDAPSAVDKTFQTLRGLSELIEEVGDKKPIGFEGLVADAAAARATIASTLGETVADLAKPFQPVAEDLAKATAATKQLDGALKAIADNKPELETLLGADGVAALEEQARSAGRVVQDSLSKPFRDILRDQTDGLAVQRLAVDGRQDEADQLALIQDLQRQYNAESAEALALELQKRGITADQLEQRLQLIAQERALSEEGQRRRDIERAHLGEVDRLRGNIERTIEDLPLRGIKVLGDFTRELQGQFQNYLARYLTETLLGGAFGQLERQLTGQDQVAAANKAYVGQTKVVVDSLRSLQQAADAAAGALDPDGIPMAEGVVITGQREPKEDPFDFRLKSPRELFGDIAKGLLTDVLGEKLAGKIGDKVGGALQGAATGRTAAGILLGSKANATGSALGGAGGQLAGEAIGKVLPAALGKFAGPFGAIAGGIIGSLLGNAFTKPKFGSASLTSATDYASVTGRGAANIQAAKGAAGSVQDGLKRIAETFDAELGSFAVTIGTYKDKFRVNTTGSSTVGGIKGAQPSTLKNFDDDEAGAIAFAITDAISDGAVKGVSAAVQKALRSSGDLEAAITEALKVKDLEELLGGLTGQLERQFKAFERQGAERLRIAKEYGFDVLAVERRNAEDRVKLIDEVLAGRVGALKDLLTDLTSGNLAEGSAAEKRRALLSEIAATEAKADAGEEGAAKRLADLNRRLVETSREAFGTAGAEYGADRAAATSSAERIIAVENERVKAAQAAAAKTNDELAKGNALAGEGNDLLLSIDGSLRQLAAGAARSGASGGGSGGGSAAGLSTSRSVIL